MRKRLYLIGAVIAAAGVLAWNLATTSGQPSGPGASNELAALFEDAWEASLTENPIFATHVGDHRYNDRLPDLSLAALEAGDRRAADFLERLGAIDRAALKPGEQVSYDIFKLLAESDRAEYRFKTHQMPITNSSGFHTLFPQLPERVPLATVADYENYLARLEAFRRYAGENVELMRAGVREGRVLPGKVLEGWETQVESHLVDDPARSLLFKPLENFPEVIGPADRDRLLARGKKAIAESVVAGYRDFRDFMAGEYLPAARESLGASDLPDGRAFYEHRVRHFTTLEISAKEVHEIGLAEVARIRGEMEAIVEKVDFEGTFEEFLESLRNDDRFYAKTPEELLQKVALTLKRMDGELPKLFKTLPRMPYGVKPVPDFIAPKSYTAYYEAPAGDGTRGGFYRVNTYDLRSRPVYEVEALSFHEAVPGHHLQIALQQEIEDIPRFRRFARFTAFSEGWALYSERLGLEVGFYQDPYSDFGRLTYEMWRALRLVIDTGIHAFGWSRQKAIDLMAENSALARHNIETEVDRYIAWPGQALGYKMGELKIRELRAKAEKTLGPAFDIREFHEVVLGSGAVPLTVLEANVEAYIERIPSN